jgi:hypothetical protein
MTRASSRLRAAIRTRVSRRQTKQASAVPKRRTAAQMKDCFEFFCFLFYSRWKDEERERWKEREREREVERERERGGKREREVERKARKRSRSCSISRFSSFVPSFSF